MSLSRFECTKPHHHNNLITEPSEYCKSNQRAHSYVVKAFLLTTRSLFLLFLHPSTCTAFHSQESLQKGKKHSMNSPAHLVSCERLHLHGCAWMFWTLIFSGNPWKVFLALQYLMRASGSLEQHYQAASLPEHHKQLQHDQNNNSTDLHAIHMTCPVSSIYLWIHKACFRLPILLPLYHLRRTHKMYSIS